MLNDAFERNYNATNATEHEGYIQEMRQMWPLVLLPLKYELISKTVVNDDPKYGCFLTYYYIPITELVTPRTLTNYLHSALCYNYNNRIREWNYVLRTNGFNQQIVPYYYNEEKVMFLIIPVDHILDYKITYSTIE